MGAARLHSSCVCRARGSPTGRKDLRLISKDVAEDLMKLKPVLVRNCRMSESPGQTDMLLMPEGVIKIKGTGRDIIALCDGNKTLSEIVVTLRAKYPHATAEQVQTDILDFLNNLRQKRVLDFK